MKKRECGQVFILTLILLAIGAALVVPSLRLTYTTVNSARIVGEQNKGLYACEAAQELVMWKLYHGTLAEDLGYDLGENSANFTVDVCGTTADVTVVMRAVELEGGVILAGEDTIMPTKTVEPTSAINKNDTGPFTYTIAIEQVSSNTTNGLDVIYDIMSPLFKGKAQDLYVPNSSYISDDGTNWTWIDNPETDFNSDALLRWPATGSFPSPFRDFLPAQTKYLKFQMNGPFNGAGIICNWVVVQVGDVFTLSGPQAPLRVMPTTETECTDGKGLFQVTKSSDPKVIPPIEETLVTYTITVSNLDGSVNRIWQVDDFLPPGFVYKAMDPTSEITAMPPDTENVTRNGVNRQHLLWESGYQEAQLGQNGVEIAAGANMTLTFEVLAVQGISGNYYNEVMVGSTKSPSLGAFGDIAGFDPTLLDDTYSWNSGVVIVPAYDSQAESEGVTVDANMALEVGGVRIISWHVQ